MDAGRGGTNPFAELRSCSAKGFETRSLRVEVELLEERAVHRFTLITGHQASEQPDGNVLRNKLHGAITQRDIQALGMKREWLASPVGPKGNRWRSDPRGHLAYGAPALP